MNRWRPGIRWWMYVRRTVLKKRHLKGAVNIQEGPKFETWLGALIAPEVPFYLVAEDKAQRDRMVRRAAKIGYETHIKSTLVAPEHFSESSQQLDLDHFGDHPEHYTIVDVRKRLRSEGESALRACHQHSAARVVQPAF